MKVRSVSGIHRVDLQKARNGYLAGGDGLNWRFLNLLNGILASVVVGQGTIGFVKCARD